MLLYDRSSLLITTDSVLIRIAQPPASMATSTTQQMGSPSTTSTPGLSGSGVPTTTNSKEPCLTSPLSQGGCELEIQTDLCIGTNTWLPTFSPKTCLELLHLLTKEQLQHEFDYNMTIGIDLGLKSNTPWAKRPDLIRVKLQNEANSLIDKYACDLSKYETLISSLSGLLEKAEQTLEEYVTATRKTTDSYTTSSPHTVHSSAAPQTSVGNSSTAGIPAPVCILNVSFKTVQWQDVCKDAAFRKIGSRQVDYYGHLEYRYGRIVHAPKNYPDNATIDYIISAIATALNDPTFNKDNVTCLITIYADGTCIIPYHSDDEASIVGDIITVNLGATRDLVFRSITGPVKQESHVLEHGTVYSMTRESQNYWEHGIPAQPSITDCRVSLTFRRLRQPPKVPHVIPPIHEPSRPASDPQPFPTERVLLLSDSLHRDIPAELFPGHLHCVKQDLYQLSDISKYEHYFENTKYVVISSGINDMSRYDHRSYSLARVMYEKLSYFSKRYPQTEFIFNSLVLTSFSWLNREVQQFNRDIFELSARLRNLWFFDSHFICSKLHERGCCIIDPAGNGVHLTPVPKREVAFCLIACIRELNANSRSIRRYWPLRREFTSTLYTR